MGADELATLTFGQESLLWQCALAALSLLGVWAGHRAFKRGQAGAASRGAAALYWLSLSPSAIWYAMPFLPQPRLHSVADLNWSRFGDVVVPVTSLVLALVAGVVALVIVRTNQRATGPGMRDFLAPASLLREGWYARVRHPMFLFDFLAHWGLSLALGALFTVLLLPLYFIASASFNESEERFVLAPRFGERYTQYRGAINAVFTPVSGIAFGVLALLTLCQFWRAI